ncbi:LamG domain-containing protein [Pendulispora brunnea]|uniref:LamG domain-containing protein n=1 Tax=Pendulispora brunnea TaxID=2905690 RepID=A0ABZ2K8R2_9BACT
MRRRSKARSLLIPAIVAVSLGTLSSYGCSSDGAQPPADAGQDRGTIIPPPAECTTIPNLVAWWKGDGSSTDQTGKHDGQWGAVDAGSAGGGPAYAPAEVGLGFLFNGATYVDVPPDRALDFTTDVSVDAWIKINPGTLNEKGGRIIDKVGNRLGYAFDVHGGGLRFFVGNATGAGGDVITEKPLPQGELIHVAAVMGAGLATVYVNGAVGAAKSIPQASPSDAALRIGAASTENAPFNGIIDEVALYSRALTATEIATLFARGPNGRCP